MFHRKHYKIRVEKPLLPAELWLIIFDIVIEDAIIWLDHCDNITFPHMESLFSPLARHYQFYDSYYRLRLVCRRFKTLLGARPWQYFFDSSSLPFPVTTRALCFDFQSMFQQHFRGLLAETSTCGRLVYLDMTCYLSEGSGPLNLSDFLHAGRAFPNVQRLTLRVTNNVYPKSQVSFWARLNCAFPSLVTLAVPTRRFWHTPAVLWLEGDDEVVHLERLEILYFKGAVAYSGCHFPRLRQASIRRCSQRELEILTLSPHLESLLIRSFYGHQIDVSSCLRLKLLGVPDTQRSKVVPLERDHPLEHLWIFFSNHWGDSRSIKELLKRQPGISRVTIDLSSLASGEWPTWITRDLQPIRFGSLGMRLRAPVQGDKLLVIERSPGLVGSLMTAWRTMRR